MDKLYAKEIKKITIRQSKGVGTSRLIYERLNYIFFSSFFFSSPLSSVFQHDSHAFCGVLFYLAIPSFFYLSCPLMVIVIKRLTFSPSFSFLAHISHTVLYSFPKVQTGGICMFNNIPRASFVGDDSLYSRYLNVWFRFDTVGRNYIDARYS